MYSGESHTATIGDSKIFLDLKLLTRREFRE